MFITRVENFHRREPPRVTSDPENYIRPELPGILLTKEFQIQDMGTLIGANRIVPSERLVVSLHPSFYIVSSYSFLISFGYTCNLTSQITSRPAWSRA